MIVGSQVHILAESINELYPGQILGGRLIKGHLEQD
jgi:hypothetical protein